MYNHLVCFEKAYELLSLTDVLTKLRDLLLTINQMRFENRGDGFVIHDEYSCTFKYTLKYVY